MPPKLAAPLVPILRVPPPLLFFATYVAGYGLQQAVPIRVAQTRATPWIHAAGLGLLAIGVLLVVSCLSRFLSARTTVLPHGRPARLVTAGPYRISRNPMYLSLVVTFVSVACLMQLLWPLFLLPVPALLVDRCVIPFEEARLASAFGPAYDRYRARVRRWL